MPSPVPAPRARPKQGSFPPTALCSATLTGTMTPSDSRCAALDFTIGLYEPPCPDQGRADGPLLSPVEPCVRAAPHTPAGPTARRSPGFGAADVALHRDVLGSAPALSLCRGGRLHVMLRPAHLLPPRRKASDAPLGRRPLDRSAGACYQASRHLPGRDSHPLARRCFQDAPREECS